MSTPDEIRIGSTDREAAQNALQRHLTEGRLDLDEYGERSMRAAQARTRAELAALFTDLPEPHPPLRPATSVPSARPWQQVAGRSTAPLLGRAGETAAALAPLVAVALFFLVWHSWLVFLLVPLTGAVVYGNRYDRPRRRHRRYRRLGC
jgi:hypothetical protein